MDKGGKKISHLLYRLSMKLFCHRHHLLLACSPQALLMGPFLPNPCNVLTTFSGRLKKFGDKFVGVIILFLLAWMTSALLFSLNTDVQRRLLQGRKQFSKLFPKICYFNPPVLTRRIKVDLQGKMLLVCLSASQTLFFLEDSSAQVPPTAQEPDSALWAEAGGAVGEHRG